MSVALLFIFTTLHSRYPSLTPCQLTAARTSVEFQSKAVLPTSGSWKMSWRLASLIAEPDKPRQADGAMSAVIASDFGVTVLIPRTSPDFLARENSVGDHECGDAGFKEMAKGVEEVIEGLDECHRHIWPRNSARTPRFKRRSKAGMDMYKAGERQK